MGTKGRFLTIFVTSIFLMLAIFTAGCAVFSSQVKDVKSEDPNRALFNHWHAICLNVDDEEVDHFAAEEMSKLTEPFYDDWLSIFMCAQSKSDLSYKSLAWAGQLSSKFSEMKIVAQLVYWKKITDDDERLQKIFQYTLYKMYWEAESFKEWAVVTKFANCETYNDLFLESLSRMASLANTFKEWKCVYDIAPKDNAIRKIAFYRMIGMVKP
ncbi:MAG: hypothetical protein COU29_00655 [Candidatus Magasanikbacteria bacterium CG10_big_fil_rev_8_21_14_0_10_36_32]|uniref:Uncharacterized protein n=1 Tax=Candidatus Magasanikbacteria bacterium CG10_big_fil_rev_8_21_14_0_10_36_32 TaxID=1974646 RepID=A0A2M6W7M8_9BACT|nr:MAG: hypothetical protein COU29_00655 [Candidatus Magasanikbacteria bacterium CG10_big_fil_rev_8_21_14_0_10_36_32]